MKVTYQTQAEESLVAGQLAASSVYTFWQRYWCIPVYLVVAVLLASFIRQAEPIYLSYFPVPFRRWIGLATFLVLFFFCLRIIQRAAMPLYARWLRERWPSRNISFSLGPDGIDIEDGKSSAMIAFSDIDQVVVGRNLIGFMRGGTMAYIPMRALSSPSDVKALVRQVLERLGDKARERSLQHRAIRDMVLA